MVLARFILRGPSQAALVMASSALLSIILMPFSWISAAALILVVLHQDKEAAFKVTAIAALAVLVMSWVIFGAPVLAAGYLLFLWLPAGLIAYVLRQSVSLTLSLQLLTVLGLLIVTGLYLLFPSMGETWREAFEQILKPALEQSGTRVDPQKLENLLQLFSHAVIGLLSIVVIFNILIGLLIARWWQAGLFNPGGLAREFNELRLGKVFASAALLFLVANTFVDNDWVLGSMLVMLTMTLVQGTAIMHGVIAKKQLSRGWMFGFYILLLLIPQVTVILAVLGLLDAWVDVRKLISPATQS
ncbi:MAG: hypothetical protein OEY36_05155 [Gammaproteobacteria bacterium]|nr:hypothetical protein [Gammaproteobacteria bacterium]